VTTCTTLLFSSSCYPPHTATVSRCTEIRLIHTSLLYSSSFGVFSVIRRHRFPHYFIKKMIKQWHLHKIFYFCTPIQPKIIIGSTCLPPSNRKPNNDLFWFPPFGMKSYYTHFRFHCCIFANNNLTQKVNPKPYTTKKKIPGHSVLVRLAFFLSLYYHFYDVCSDLTLLYLKIPTPTTSPNHFP